MSTRCQHRVREESTRSEAGFMLGTENRDKRRNFSSSVYRRWNISHLLRVLGGRCPPGMGWGSGTWPWCRQAQLRRRPAGSTYRDCLDPLPCVNSTHLKDLCPGTSASLLSCAGPWVGITSLPFSLDISLCSAALVFLHSLAPPGGVPSLVPFLSLLGYWDTGQVTG